MTTYRQYRQSLVPTTMQRPVGQAFQGEIGDVEDAAMDRAKQSVKARFPLLAPPDALTAIGRERMIPQAPGESNASYAARLQDAWNTWPWAGTPFGVLRALYSSGYRNVVLAQVRGGVQYTLDNGGTNLLRWSNRFNAISPWQTNQTYTLAVGVAAPDGSTSASTLTATASQGGPFQNISPTISVTGTYVLSGLAQSAAGNNFFLRLRDNTTPANGVFTFFNAAAAWARFSIVANLTAGDSIDALFGVTTIGLAVNFWGLQLEQASALGPYSQTYGIADTTTLGAGALVSSTMACGLWETDPLSAYSPPNQTLWSKFTVLFPLPLIPPNWGWAGGIPASNSAEANFIRSLIQTWKPASSTCDRIVIQTQGKLFGYPAAQLWGTSGQLWGAS